MSVLIVEEKMKELSRLLKKIAMLIYYKKDKLANKLLLKSVELSRDIQVCQGKFDLQKWMKILIKGNETRYRRADRALTAAAILS